MPTTQNGNGQLVILVVGATGNQGGAVVDALLAPRRWHVRALTRSPKGKKARALAARGVEVFGGDLADASSLKPALNGAYGAFSVQNSMTAGLANEKLQGITFAGAALAAGVKHFISTSAGGADRDSGIPHFETKYHIEPRSDHPLACGRDGCEGIRAAQQIGASMRVSPLRTG